MKGEYQLTLLDIKPDSIRVKPVVQKRTAKRERPRKPFSIITLDGHKLSDKLIVQSAPYEYLNDTAKLEPILRKAKFKKSKPVYYFHTFDFFGYKSIIFAQEKK